MVYNARYEGNYVFTKLIGVRVSDLFNRHYIIKHDARNRLRRFSRNIYPNFLTDYFLSRCLYLTSLLYKRNAITSAHIHTCT